MINYINDKLREIEASHSIKTREQAFRELRQLGFEDFAEVLMHMPMAEYPKLSHILPKMAPDKVQDGWTGTHGYPLLHQSIAFARAVCVSHVRFGACELSKATILDYGCGYGRIARLMYYFADIDNVFGVDPWNRSIEECHSAGLVDNFAQSDFLPTSLPVGDVRFDLTYAFSVYTHLSERTAARTIDVIREYTNPGGLAIITIRPIEFWDKNSALTPTQRAALKQDHVEKGFAFFPMGWPAEDGVPTYGNTSMTLEWIDDNFKGWKRLAIDRHLNDWAQLHVVLQKTLS